MNSKRPAKQPSQKPNPKASTKPRRLGRGLAALIDDPVTVPTVDSSEASGSTRTTTPESDGQADTAGPSAGPTAKPDAASSAEPSLPADTPAAGVLELDIDSLEPNKYQPRRTFNEAALKELADSIKAQGLLQPVVVRPITSPVDSSATPRYELIAGERRWRAATIAGMKAIPAIVREATDQAAAELALVENVQREDLNPIDRARALGRLINEFGMTQGQVGERVGLDRSSVANLVRLTELEPVLQDMIARGLLTGGHGKALLAAPAGEARIDLGERATRESWSVRATERAARDAVNGSAKPKAPKAGPADKSPELADLEAKLGEHLGTKVRVQLDASKTKGQLVVQFFDLDHFDGLMAKLGYRPD